MILKFKKLYPDAKVPTYAHEHDAGMDLYASEHLIIKRGETSRVPTGIALEIPEGYVGLVWDKSGLSTNHGLKTIGGVIDAGYRGEIIVGLFNLSKEDYTVEKHQKIAQLLIQKVERAGLLETDALSDSHRGEKGFGSTGKH